MGVLVQVIATIALCITCVNMGITSVWPSSTLLLFKSENTTLHRVMTDMDVNLYTSLPLVGALVAQPLILLGVMDRLGLKRTMILSSLHFVIAWSIVAVTNRVEAILLVVIINGSGSVTFMVAIIYISEISQDSIRGALTSGPNLSCGLGMLVSYLLGGILEYHMMVYTCLSFAVIGTSLLVFLKESPVRLMAKGREEEAAKSLSFYRQASAISKDVLTELYNIRRCLNIKTEDAQSLMRVEQKVTDDLETQRKSCWQLFKTIPAIRRQFYLMLVLQIAYAYQGLPSVEVYAEPIFAATVDDTVSPNLCSVVLGIILLSSTFVAAILVDTIGRRPLQIHSSVVCGITSFFIGTQILTEWFPKWTILLFIYTFGISHTIGSGCTGFVITAELLPPEVKHKLLIIIYEVWTVCSYSCMFIFGIVAQSYGLAPMFFLFSFFSFATSVYFYCCLPETKGLPVYAIQALFTKETDN